MHLDVIVTAQMDVINDEPPLDPRLPMAMISGGTVDIQWYVLNQAAHNQIGGRVAMSYLSFITAPA